MKKGGVNAISLKGFLSFQILHALRQRKLCGDELAELIGEKKRAKLTPGTIYPAMKNLRRKKLVLSMRDGRKKLYSLTPQGVMEYNTARRAFRRIFKDLLRG